MTDLEHPVTDRDTATCMCGEPISLHDRPAIVGGGQEWAHDGTDSPLCYPDATDDSRECVAEPEPEGARP